MMKCPECSSKEIFATEHEQLCRNCGLVIEEEALIQDWVSKPREEIESAPSLGKTMPVHGKIVRSSWLYSTREKTLVRAHEDLLHLAELMKLPKRIGKDACILYTKAAERNLTVGRKAYPLLAACLYLTALQQKSGLTYLDVALRTKVNHHTLRRYTNALANDLGINKVTTDIETLMHEFAERIGAPYDAVLSAQELYTHLRPTGVFGARTPIVVASTLLYLGCLRCGHPVTQRTIDYKTGVYEQTLRKFANKLQGLLERK